MNVHLVVEVGRELDRVTGPKVPRTIAHEEGIQTLIGSTLPGSHRVQTTGREARLRNGVWLRAPANPLDDLGEVLRKAGFRRGAVQFAEHSTPIPAAKLGPDSLAFSFLTEDGEDRSERYELRSVREILWREEILAHEQATGLLVSSNRRFSPSLVILKAQTGGRPCVCSSLLVPWIRPRRRRRQPVHSIAGGFRTWRAR